GWEMSGHRGGRGVRMATGGESNIWGGQRCLNLPPSTRGVRAIPLRRPMSRLPSLTVRAGFAHPPGRPTAPRDTCWAVACPQILSGVALFSPGTRNSFDRQSTLRLEVSILSPTSVYPSSCGIAQGSCRTDFRLAETFRGKGVVASRFMAGNGALGWFMWRWAGLFGASAEEGARMSVYRASSPEVEDVTGKYFAKQKSVAPSPAPLD